MFFSGYGVTLFFLILLSVSPCSHTLFMNSCGYIQQRLVKIYGSCIFSEPSSYLEEEEIFVVLLFVVVFGQLGFFDFEQNCFFSSPDREPNCDSRPGMRGGHQMCIDVNSGL